MHGTTLDPVFPDYKHVECISCNERILNSYIYMDYYLSNNFLLVSLYYIKH